jgi:hypothetical protein
MAQKGKDSKIKGNTIMASPFPGMDPYLMWLNGGWS